MLEDQTLENANPNGYDEVVFMRNGESIEAFSSQVITIMTQHHQVLQTEDGALPQGLTIHNAYTELQKVVSM